MRSPVRLFASSSVSSALDLASGFRLGALGRRRGGSRFSPLDQITPGNVGNLVRAWEFRTGDLDSRAPEMMKRTKFQATPLLVEDSLIFCSPFNEVDRARSRQRRAEMALRSEDLAPASARPTATIAAASPIGSTTRRPRRAACRARIFMGTNDVRVIALDARTGIPCADFGTNGEIRLETGGPLEWPGEFQITSAPVVSPRRRHRRLRDCR